MVGLIGTLVALLAPVQTLAGPTKAAPSPPIYETVLDIEVDAKGFSKACRVIQNSDVSIDPCESIPIGEPLAIPTGAPISMAGIVRIRTTATFRQR